MESVSTIAWVVSKKTDSKSGLGPPLPENRRKYFYKQLKIKLKKAFSKGPFSAGKT